MLGKVIKFDLKATCRFFLPMYIGLAVLTLINKLSLEFMFDTTNPLLNSLAGIAILFYALGLFAIFIMTQIFIVWHFYKNLTGDEGYLMFTLPVKASTHVNAKIVTSIVWSVSTVILVIISFIVLASGHGIGEFFTEMGEGINELMRSPYRSEVIVLFVEIALLMVIGLFSSPLVYFCSIALGHLFGKHKILGAVVSYIGISMVLQIIATVFTVFVGLSNQMMPDNSFHGVYSVVNEYMIFSLIFSVLTTAVFYLISTYIFTWKLNLE